MATTLLGNSTTTFTNAKTFSAGKIAVAEFESLAAGTMTDMELYVTSATCTSLIVGIYENFSNAPRHVLAQATFSGTPGSAAWCKIGGFNLTISASTFYWLAFLPIGGEITIHTAQPTSGGSNFDESSASTYTELTEPTWAGVKGLGPIAFRGIEE